MTRRCDQCEFWVLLYRGGEGDCRRQPPQVVAKPYKAGDSAWPVTKGADWCGEFRQKESGNGGEK